MNKVIAIISARLGSKSIVDKNISLLSRHPLITYSIAVAILSKKIKMTIQRHHYASGYKVLESPLKWFVRGSDYFLGVVANEDYNLPKEAFEQIYIPDSFVDVVKVSFVMNGKEIHGNKMIGFESPVCTEVDSVEEFEYIQLDKNGSGLLDYLNKIKG